jgi:hypothetical protein
VKHPLFAEEPMMKVAAIFHNSKHEKFSHNLFFSCLVDRHSWINSKKNVIVTDREAGIKKSIEKHLPNVVQLHCFNHIKQV